MKLELPPKRKVPKFKKDKKCEKCGYTKKNCICTPAGMHYLAAEEQRSGFRSLMCSI